MYTYPKIHENPNKTVLWLSETVIGELMSNSTLVSIIGEELHIVNTDFADYVSTSGETVLYWNDYSRKYYYPTPIPPRTWIVITTNEELVTEIAMLTLKYD